MRFWQLPGLVLFHLIEQAWLPCECVTVSVLWLFCVLCCGQGRAPRPRGLASPEEIESGIQVVSTVAFRRVYSGRPKRSQLLSTRAFHAGSEAREEGLSCTIARRIACCASCTANLKCRGLNVRRATQVLDAVPRDVVEPLERP